jgi:hypothetical protein
LDRRSAHSYSLRWLAKLVGCAPPFDSRLPSINHDEKFAAAHESASGPARRSARGKMMSEIEGIVLQNSD